jgi:hypothetical protein
MPPFLWTQKQDIGPGSRVDPGLAYDLARHRIVLFGGDPGGPPLADTWAWDGALWTQVADTGPTGRHSSAMTYDAARQVVVLFGGASGSSRSGDTWTWDGEAWTQVADTGPTARAGHAMAYDGSRQMVVLFGGRDGGGPLGDTWEWDGVEWTQVEDVGPSPRSGHATVFDPVATNVVLFGGADATGSGLADTWTWDGTAWTQAADTGPDPRAAVGLVAAGTVVLFGGVNSFDPAMAPADRVIYSDSWRWDGGAWTKVQDIGPSARWGHAMGFRSDAGRIVLFGGSTIFAPAQDASLQPGVLRDTWEHAEAASQPDDGGGGGQPVDVASVTVNPDTASSQGDTLDVTVTLTGPAPADVNLIAGIFFDTGGGNFQPSQTPGFSMPPQPFTVLAGASQTQFQIVRDGNPLPAGNYAIGVGLDGGQTMAGGFFTVT